MRNHGVATVLAVILGGCFLAAVDQLSAQDSPGKAELPVLLTSCGQSPGPERVKFFLKRLDLVAQA